MMKPTLCLLSLVLLDMLACSGSSSPTSPTTTLTTSSLPAMYSHFVNTVEVYRSGDTVVVKTDDLPNHPSPYYGVGSAMYIAPPAEMVVNPNRIMAQNYELRIPATPQVRGGTTATPLDAIGIAVNGVVLFNQYAAGFSPLDQEKVTFDQYNGHPAGRGNYHYHVDPIAITAANPAALIGVLLDGFPVYGTVDGDGSTPADLDECNGHVRTTADFPEGIYHYHITSGYPYISGCFKGTAGSATN